MGSWSIILSGSLSEPIGVRGSRGGRMFRQGGDSATLVYPFAVFYLVCELGQSRGAVSAIVLVERGTMEVIVHVPCIYFLF